MKTSEFLCGVCSLPASYSPCSERCRILQPSKKRVESLSPKIDRAILDSVASLKPPKTACPGVLALAILEKFEWGPSTERDALALLRSHYRALRDLGKIRLYQKGICVPLSKWPRGAFRLGK